MKATRFILAAKLFSAPYAKAFDVGGLPFEDETHKTIARYIAEHEKSGEKIRPSELFELLDENSEEFNAILDLNYEDKLSGEVAARFFSDSVRTLERQAIEREIAAYNEAYALETDEEKRKEVAKKLTQCVSRRNKLKK